MSSGPYVMRVYGMYRMGGEVLLRWKWLRRDLKVQRMIYTGPETRTGQIHTSM